LSKTAPKQLFHAKTLWIVWQDAPTGLLLGHRLGQHFMNTQTDKWLQRAININKFEGLNAKTGHRMHCRTVFLDRLKIGSQSITQCK